MNISKSKKSFAKFQTTKAVVPAQKMKHLKGGDPEGHSGNVAIIVDWC